MSNVIVLALALVAGGALGAIFFGGLWWTVSKGIPSKEPALWLFGSLILRTSLVVAGFYIVARGHWDRALLCLMGFVIARYVVARLIRGTGEVSHAS